MQGCEEKGTREEAPKTPIRPFLLGGRASFQPSSSAHSMKSFSTKESSPQRFSTKESAALSYS